MIKVMIVDDQEIVREGLKMVISLHEEIDVIGEAANGQELLTLLNSKTPEVILMDIRMPFMNGIEATRAVKAKYPNIKIVILTTFDEDEYIFDVLKNGADGYVLKDSGSKEIISAVKAAFNGEVLLNPKITSKVIKALNSSDTIVNRRNKASEDNSLLNSLTQREREVTEHIMNGKTNKAIAEAMFVTEGTVKNYVSKILEKLQVSSRAELILYLQKHR